MGDAQQDGVAPNEDDVSELKKNSTQIAARAAIGAVLYPLTYVKTLFQLGYEPYPLTRGKTYIIAGRDAYFYPNAVTYIRNIVRERGLLTIYSGVGPAVVATALGGITTRGVSMYLDRFYPEVGGEPPEEEKQDIELTAHESARAYLRDAIRDSISHSLAIICSRPFTVIMVRQIAEHVGGESKYRGFLESIFCIGQEEGPAGFFSGVMPALVAEFIVIWGCATIRYAVGRCLKDAMGDRLRVGEGEGEEDEEKKKVLERMSFVAEYAIPFFVNSISYPFNVVSTVMAISGSGLAVALLPYSPSFSHWNDAYSYMKPHGTTRGSRLFLREHKGAISPALDGTVYASNKHFVL